MYLKPSTGGRGPYKKNKIGFFLNFLCTYIFLATHITTTDVKFRTAKLIPSSR